MTINANTRIAADLSPSRDALKLITGINGKWAKFRSVITGKLIPGRATPGMNAKIRSYDLNDFDNKFTPDSSTTGMNVVCPEAQIKTLPGNVFDECRATSSFITVVPVAAPGWDQLMTKYKSHLHIIDLRSLDTPISIMTITGELRYMTVGIALCFTLLTSIPVFFLDRLEKEGFDYRVKIVSEGAVNLLVFKPE